jgi:hypothetical protein
LARISEQLKLLHQMVNTMIVPIAVGTTSIIHRVAEAGPEISAVVLQNNHILVMGHMIGTATVRCSKIDEEHQQLALNSISVTHCTGKPRMPG